MTPETPAEKLRASILLHESGVRMMQASLKRRHPELTEDELQGKLQQWLWERPGAELGDGVGTPREL